MNKNNRAMPAALMLAVCAAMLVACATKQRFERNCIAVAGSASTATEVARRTWTNYVWLERARVPDPAKRQDLEKKVAEIGQLYSQYQAAMDTFEAALVTYHLAPTNQQPVMTALQVMSATSGNIIALVNSLTQK